MAAEAVADGGLGLEHAVALLAAGVVAAPIFLRLGLGSVLGYLAAGLAIGPYGLHVINDPEAILHVAELGVVMFLFLIGLEMRPAKLWALRRDIFGLGLAHVLACGAILTAIGVLWGLNWQAALVAGLGFALSSTAVIMKMLEDVGESSTPAGAGLQLIVADFFFQSKISDNYLVAKRMRGEVNYNNRQRFGRKCLQFYVFCFFFHFWQYFHG